MVILMVSVCCKFAAHLFDLSKLTELELDAANFLTFTDCNTLHKTVSKWLQMNISVLY